MLSTKLPPIEGTITDYFDQKIPYEYQLLTPGQQDHSISVSEHGLLFQLSTALMFYSDHMNKDQINRFIVQSDELFARDRKTRMTEIAQKNNLPLPNSRLSEKETSKLTATLNRWVHEIFNIEDATAVVFDATEPYEVTYVDYRVIIPLENFDAPLSEVMDRYRPVLDFLYDATEVTYDTTGLTTPIFTETD